MTDGSKPEKFPDSPFIGFADKSDPTSIEDGLQRLLETGIPQLARRVHDEIDKDAGQYLWSFIEQNWDDLINRDALLLERLIRRRASILISRITSNGTTIDEIEDVEGLEYYIYPPISGNSLRLGEIMRKSDTPDEFVVILTPHCHLTIQSNATEPRAEYVLTLRTRKADELMAAVPIEAKKATKKLDEIRRRIQGPSQFNGKPNDGFTKTFKPDGRYYFLPGFLEIPDLYCDFLQVNSISYEELQSSYESIAVLDTPFAEALQGSFTAFYSAVGTPNLNPERFNHLLNEPDS